ncbi:MAG: hypothetical protein H0V01_01205 [Bacteroidetes bacterium]|nr:hypothetical protein [Bacteroidota bacterium]
MLKSKINFTNLILAIIGFGTIAFFINIKTALFLIVFLSEIAVVTYLFMNIYNYFISKRDIKLLRLILVLVFIALAISSLLYFFYGTYALLKPLSISALIFVMVLGFNWWLSKRNG